MNQFNALGKFFENQGNEGNELEKLFGNTSRIAQFAQFYVKHAEIMAVISAGKTIDYLSDEIDHDSREFAAFKAGLGVWPLIFESCYKEVQRKKIEEAEKSPQES